VGHLTAHGSVLPRLSPFRLSAYSWEQLSERQSLRVGVGHDPDSVALVRGAGVVSAKHSPSSIEPHLGQVSENSAKPPSSEDWRVFHEREAGSYFTNDAGHFHPQAGSLTLDTGALTGRANVLTRKSPRYDIHNIAPRLASKSRNVRPNWEGGQNSIVLSLCKNGRGEGIKFNGADGSPPEEFPPEYSSTSAREKSQLIQWFPHPIALILW
jgi:hypothetical protein